MVPHPQEFPIPPLTPFRFIDLLYTIYRDFPDFVNATIRNNRKCRGESLRDLEI